MWALRFLQMKRAGVVLALLLTAVPNQSALALTIFPFRTGMALDYDEDGTGESGVGTSTMQVYYNFPGIGGGGESRGIIEFPISSLSSPVAAAHLTMAIEHFQIGIPNVSFGIYGKPGDGNIDASDFALGAPAGTFNFFPGQPPFVSVDVTTLINSFITSIFPPPPSFATLQIVWQTPGHSDDFVSFSNPVLEIEQTPLPAALPLFATGLGALSLLGWRRKRKAAALAA